MGEGFRGPLCWSKPRAPKRLVPPLRVPGEGLGSPSCRLAAPESSGGEMGERVQSPAAETESGRGAGGCPRPRPPRAWLGSWPAACGWSPAPVGAALRGDAAPPPRHAGPGLRAGGLAGGPQGQGSPPQARVGGTGPRRGPRCGHNKYVCSREARPGAVRPGPAGREGRLCLHTGAIVRIHATAARGRKGQTPLGPVGSTRGLGPLRSLPAVGASVRIPAGPGTGRTVPGSPAEAGGKRRPGQPARPEAPGPRGRSWGRAGWRLWHEGLPMGAVGSWASQAARATAFGSRGCQGEGGGGTQEWGGRLVRGRETTGSVERPVGLPGCAVGLGAA